MATWIAMMQGARVNAAGIPDYRGGEVVAMVKGTVDACPFTGRHDRKRFAIVCVNAGLAETRAALGLDAQTPQNEGTKDDPKFGRRLPKAKWLAVLDPARAFSLDASYDPKINNDPATLPRVTLAEASAALDATAPAEKAPAKEGGGVELLGVSMLAVASLFGGRGPAVFAWLVGLACAWLMLRGLSMGAGDTITLTVGSDVADDYSTWATAEAAIPADPVEHYTLTAARDEELSGGVTVNVSNGNAVQILLTAVASARRAATDPLRYGYGARITSSSRAASIQTSGVVVEWLSLKTTGGGWETFTIFNASGVGRYLVIEAPAGVYGALLYINDCLLHDSVVLATAAGSVFGISVSRIGGVGGSTNAKVWRCTVLSRSATYPPVYVYAGTGSANSIDARNVLAWSTTGLACYAVQAGTFPGEFAAASDYLAGNDASAATYAATVSYPSIAVSPFADIAATTEDMHWSDKGEALNYPGAMLDADTVGALDIDGQKRGFNPVGADDYPPVGGGPWLLRGFSARLWGFAPTPKGRG